MVYLSGTSLSRSLLLVTSLVALGFSFGCGKKVLTEEEVLLSADQYVSQGQYDQAIATLENFLQTHPGALDVIEALAFAYMQDNDPEVAAYYFSRAAEVDSAQPEYYLYAANALKSINNYSGASESFRKYLTVRPRDHTVLVQLAELNAELGNRSAALDNFLQANRVKNTAPVQNKIAQLYLEAGNQVQAQTWFASAAQYGGESRADALVGLTEVALKAKRFADAEKLVEVLNQEFPGKLESSHLADTMPQLREWRKQQDAATKAVARIGTPKPNPPPPETNPPPSEHPEEAAPEPTEETPDEVVAETPTEAAPPSEEPVEATSESPALFPEPEELPAGTIAETPGTPLTPHLEFVRKARAEANQGNYDESIRNYQRALARDNSNPQVWSELSRSQILAGKFVPALASANEAIRRDPARPAYLLQYFEAAEEAMPAGQRMRELEAAHRKFPENPDLALKLADSYEETSHPSYAQRMLQEFLRLAPPNHPERAEVEARLNSF